MSENRGKQFEEIIKKSFLKVPNTSVVRLQDQMGGYSGAANHCDFIVYHKPYEYHIECKTVHGNTLSIYSPNEKRKYGNITNKQWEGLSEYDKVEGVIAGVICWWVDHDITGFLDIGDLNYIRNVSNQKSIRYDVGTFLIIKGRKKRVFFDYDMEEFFNELR